MPRPNRPPPGFFNESRHPRLRTEAGADAPSSGGGAGGAPVGFKPGVGGILRPPNLKAANPPMRRVTSHPPRTTVGADAPSSGGGAGGDLVRAFERCLALLDDLLREDDGWVFEDPVDARTLCLRDYYTVIADPMDLGTVRRRLLRSRYADPSDFAADVRLTFRNAMSYNNRGDPVYESAVELSRIFEDRWASIQAELPPPPPTDAERRVRFNDDLTLLPVATQRTVAQVLKERGACLLEKKGKVQVDLSKVDAATLDELDRVIAGHRAADPFDPPTPLCRIDPPCETEEPRRKRRCLVLLRDMI